MSDVCKTCGACCVVGCGRNLLPAWANVEFEERDEVLRHVSVYDLHVFPPIDWWDEETEALRTKTMDCQDGPAAGKPLTVCRFLRGTPGVAVHCQIYPHRPSVCKEYQPESDYCRKKRAEVF